MILYEHKNRFQSKSSLLYLSVLLVMEYFYMIISLLCLSSGSESCSSVGSSSSSLSRPQLPLPASASSWSNVPSAPLIHPAADTRGSGHPEMIKSVPSQPPSATDATNYYVLPLEASGIPPGSVLVNPHTGG